MKKVLILLISCLLMASSFVNDVFADTLAEGLYEVNNIEKYHSNKTNSVTEYLQKEEADKYLQSAFNIVLGGGSFHIFVYCDGEQLINVTDFSDLSISGVGVSSQKTKMKDNDETVIDIMGDSLGQGSVSYLGKKINFGIIYPNLFIKNDNIIETNINLNPDKSFDLSQILVCEDGVNYSKVDTSKIIIEIEKGGQNSYSRTENILTCNEDDIELKIKYPRSQNETEYHDITVHFVNEGGSGDGPRPELTDISVIQGIVPEDLNSKFVFEYDGAKYRLGLGNGSSDSGTLHIDDGGMVDLSSDNGQETSGCGGSILIGKLDGNGEIAEPAKSEVYGLFTNLSYKVVANNPSGITAGYYRENLEKLHTETDSIIVEVRKDKLDYKQKDKAMIEVSFDYAGKNHTIQFGIDIEKPVKVSFNAESVAQLNSIFADETALALAAGKTIDRDTNIEISLNPEKTYSGIIEINCGNNFHDLIIDGCGATVQGIKTKESISQIKDVNFVAANSDASGLVVDNDTLSDKMHSLYIVQNCNFTGYKYGVYTNGYGLISGIENCTFTNCDVGIYTNSMISTTYSDSLGDTFIDCKTGIEIKRIPDTSTPYQFVMRNMTFITNSSNTAYTNYSDYKIHCNGKFFYTGNYYGEYTGSYSDIDNLMSKLSIRSAKVSYTGTDTSKTKIYTNPCIRYPEQEQAVLGIDPGAGLFTAILSGDDAMSHINASDLDVNINLDICQKGTGDQLAVLSFREDN